MKKIREIFYGLHKLSRKWEPYLDNYDRYLPQYLDTNPTMLVVGIAQGGCVEMFSKYFDNAVTIHGVDNNEKCMNYTYDNPNVQLTCGDQSSNDYWDTHLKDNPMYDIIVDDGGHEMDQQIVTLNRTFPHLKDGGIYVIEDTHTSYWEQWGGGFKKETSFVEYVKNLIDLIHIKHIKDRTAPPELTKIFKNLKCVTIYDSFVILEKGNVAPFNEAISAYHMDPKFAWNHNA